MMNHRRISPLVAAILLMSMLLLPGASLAQTSLDVTYTTPDGAFEIDHPSAWDAFDDFGYIAIENVPGTTVKDLEDLTSDELAVLIVPPNLAGDLGLAEEDTPLDGVDLFRFDTAGNEREVREVALAVGQTGLRLDLSDLGAERMALFFTAHGGGLTVLLAASGVGGLDVYEATLLNMAATFRRAGENLPDTPPQTNAGDAMPRPPVASIEDVDLGNLPALTGNYMTLNGELSVNYPSGWDAFEEDTISLLTPGSVTSGAVPPGEVSVYIRVPDIIPFNGVAELAPTPRTIIAQWGLLFRLVYPNLEASDFGRMETFMLAGRESYIMTYRSFFGDIALIGFALEDGSVVMVYAISATGEMPDVLPTVVAIAESLRLVRSGA